MEIKRIGRLSSSVRAVASLPLPGEHDDVVREGGHGEEAGGPVDGEEEGEGEREGASRAEVDGRGPQPARHDAHPPRTDLVVAALQVGGHGVLQHRQEGEHEAAGQKDAHGLKWASCDVVVKSAAFQVQNPVGTHF